jgi:hypothetical protein
MDDDMTFKPPPDTGYLLIAAEIEPLTGRTPFVRNSPRQQQFSAGLRPFTERLRHQTGVDRVSVYRACFAPPIGRAVRPGAAARFDVCILVETTDAETAERVSASDAFADAVAFTTGSSDPHRVRVIRATCIRNVAPVDATRRSLFLFNYFVQDGASGGAVSAWERLVRWYRDHTGLENSTLLAPVPGSAAEYVFINRASWDIGPLRLAIRQFRSPSFGREVRGSLRAAGLTSIPVFYRAV